MGIETLQFDEGTIQEKYGVEVDYNRAKEVVEMALAHYLSDDESEDNFFTGKEQPEDRFIQFLRDNGETEDFTLNSLFLLTMMNFSGNTSVFFNRLLSRDDYEQFRWLFEPSIVAEKTENEVMEAAQVYLNPQGHQSNALIGWHHNCVELMKYGRDQEGNVIEGVTGNVREFLRAKNYDALEIIQALFVRPRARSKEKEFWRFGPKLSILFLQWVDRYQLCPELTNIDNIGIPVDFEICRLAVQLGIVNIQYEVNAHNLSFNILLPMFIKLFKETGWKPRYGSEALWSIGSRGCSRERPLSQKRNTKCPVKNLCKGVYSKPRDNKGRYYSLDRMGIRYVPWKPSISSY